MAFDLVSELRSGSLRVLRRIILFGTVLGLALPLAATVSAPGVLAQDKPSPYMTVKSRPRPDYDAIGGRAGAFVIYPSVDVSAIYDDNIFREDTGEDGDFITSIQPEVKVESQWSNHALNFGAGADIRIHADESDENTTDYFVRADGRIDVQRNTNIFGGASYNNLHEGRGDPNSPVSAREPVEYDLVRANAGAYHRFNRVSVEVTGDVADYDYDNSINRNTGAVIVQNDRNRQEYKVAARVGYEIQKEFEAFVRGTLDFRDYDRLQGGFNRDSDGYEVVVGTAFDLTGLIYGEVFAGLRSQEFDDPRLADVDGGTLGGSLTWNVTGLTTINGFVTRSVEETTIANAAGFFATTVGASVDHELRRNILLNGSASYSTYDYEGVGREDDYIRFGVGGTYLINRYSRVGVRYDLENRDSNVAGSDYHDNVFRVNARLQF